MQEPQKRGWLPPLIDMILLVAVLVTAFWRYPAPRPELAMLGAAAVVQLFLGPRSGRFALNSLVSATVTALLFAFYWQRPADAKPLAVWLVLVLSWRWVIPRLPALGRRIVRGSSTFLPMAKRVVTGMRALVDRPAVRLLQWVMIVAAGAALMWPYLAKGTTGAGDAYWYTITVADYVEQMRAGFFPLWTAQSDYAFYGGIFPLRLAPYMAHLAAVVDLLTARQLPPYAVLNVMLGLSLAGGMLSMYRCLRAIAPAHSWSAMGIALCYGLCPGVLGLAYGQDLFMSFCTLPFLPVAFLGAVQCFTRDDLGPRLLIGAGLAAAWLAHPPIGMWCGFVIAGMQVARLVTRRDWRATWKQDAIGAGVFLLLAGYSFVSVKSLGPLWKPAIPPGGHFSFVRSAFPGNWLPLDTVVRSLRDIQLGYGLAALGLLVAFFSRGPGLRPTRVLLGCAAVLLVMVLPIPFVTERAWLALPETVLTITNVWPTQRLMVALAVCVSMAAAVWLAHFQGSRWIVRSFQLLLLAALVWGGFEAGKFIRLSNRFAQDWAATEVKFRSENRAMTYSAVGSHPIQPRTFNHGVTDFRLEHRFLSPDAREIIRNATDAIIPGFGPGTSATSPHLTRELTGEPNANPGILDLGPRLTLEPGKRYLLAFEFLPREYKGVLLIDGEGFSRIYSLPDAGNERAFGSGPANARWLSLWQTSGRPVEVSLRWVPADRSSWGATKVLFAHFDFREYDPAGLDVVVESLLPYRATVDAPAESYLETPRLFYPGYRANVDGRPASVERSADGFAMIKLSKGRHAIELTYVAPLLARFAYWIGAAGWVGFLIMAVRTFRRERVVVR